MVPKLRMMLVADEKTTFFEMCPLNLIVNQYYHNKTKKTAVFEDICVYRKLDSIFCLEKRTGILR